MNAQEANVLLTKAGFRDRYFKRAPDDLAQMSLEWSSDLADIPLDVAIDALRRHYSEQTRTLMIADIRAFAEDMAPGNGVRLADGPAWLRAHGVNAEQFQARVEAGERPARVLRELGVEVPGE